MGVRAAVGRAAQRMCGPRMLDRARSEVHGDRYRPIARSLARFIVSTVVRPAVKRLRLPAPRALHEADNRDFTGVGVAQMRSSGVRDDIPIVGGHEVWTSPTGSDTLA